MCFGNNKLRKVNYCCVELVKKDIKWWKYGFVLDLGLIIYFVRKILFCIDDKVVNDNLKIFFVWFL